MIKLKDLIKFSDKSIQSYQLSQDIYFYRQISDVEFEKTKIQAKKDEVYDGIIVLKRNNQFYLDLGWDSQMELNLFLPMEGNIIDKFKNKNLKNKKIEIYFYFKYNSIN